MHWEGLCTERWWGTGSLGMPRRGQALIKDECTEVGEEQGRHVLSGLVCCNRSITQPYSDAFAQTAHVLLSTNTQI